LHYNIVLKVNDYYNFKYVSLKNANKYLFPLELGRTQRVIKSYLTAKGDLNNEYVVMLKQKLVSMIMKSPGITEESILRQTFPMVEPTSVKDILNSLETAKIILSKPMSKTTVTLLQRSSIETKAYFVADLWMYDSNTNKSVT
jgi:hypothetical protein